MTIPKPAHPRPDKFRARWLNLNGEWDFSLNSDALDGKITVPFSWASPLSGVARDEKGEGVYRRFVDYAPQSENRLFLIVGAADYTCRVFVNGQLLNTHSGGYSPIETEVTAVWKREGRNEIILRVEDNDLDFQTRGKQGYGECRGVWQTVYLEERPKIYIDSFRVKTALSGRVTIDVKLAGGEDTVTAEFGDFSASSVNGRIELEIPSPILWDTENPHLYRGALSTPGGDRVETYFGIREIGTGKFGSKNINYITLNGKPVYLNGTLDQSFNPDGFFTLPTNEAEKEEIMRMKRLGLNMARIHIKSEEPLKLYWADALGLLIMEDIPCFWGAPDERERGLFERQMYESIDRDVNRPSVFYWIIFNESWGLLTAQTDSEGKTKKVYLPETREWVRRLYRDVKAYDPTRPVEDNSPCRRDHVETDVNTWHFYSNGYENVKRVVDGFCDGAHPGSAENYIGENRMGDVPVMNSECGNVWGIEGNAGDSDLSWHYRYMMNEFRLHGKLCGFVFTEFHDVVNEFNGYYRIDNTDKIFGYEAYVPGMTVRDLHAKEFIALDCPPMRTVSPGELVEIPIFASNFSDEHLGQTLTVSWRLRLESAARGARLSKTYTEKLYWNDWGAFSAGSIRMTIPEDADTCTSVLEVWLSDGAGKVLSRNFTAFDVAPGLVPGDSLDVPLAALEASGFEKYHGAAQEGEKLNGVGEGNFKTYVEASRIPGLENAFELEVLFEASARPLMSRDLPDAKTIIGGVDLDYMHGCRVDRSANKNAFFMTDEYQNLSRVEVIADGVSCGTFPLADAPADSRGLLSWHYQKVQNKLDEAGTYGYLCRAKLPSGVLMQLQTGEKTGFTLELRSGDGGLSIFGRRSGRYACGLWIRAIK